MAGRKTRISKAKPISSKTKTGGKKSKAGGGGELDSVFDELQGMLSVHVPPFKATSGGVRNKRDYHLTVPVPVVLSPEAYGGKPYPVSMASLILQKGYVGFYFGVYGEPELKKKLAPELVALLEGKSCFHVKKLTPEVREGIKAALELGKERFRGKGWV